MHSQENENSFKVSNFDICFQQMCIFLFECSSLTLKSLTYLFDFNLSNFLIDCGLFKNTLFEHVYTNAQGRIWSIRKM